MPRPDAESMPYPRLWEPGRIGALELPNRVVMAAMFMGYADPDGSFSERHVDYLAARAEGGAGLVVTESVLADTAIQKVHPEAPVTLCDRDGVIPRLQRLARAVHRHGAKISLQVSPGQGRQSHFVTPKTPPKAPSPVPAFADPRVTCEELSPEEIRRLVEACGDGALRAVIAGFDMVEIHAHTGYLVDQFMSSLWNRRSDAWGGDLEGRLRFPVEIVRAIRQRVGPRVPIGFRLTAEHRIEGGRTLDEALDVARRLEDAGVDALTVDAGCYEAEHWMNPPVYHGEACLVSLAEAVREVVDIPVVAVGNLTRPEVAEAVLERGQADFVALGRSFLADPDWARKAREGRSDEIRPCIMCNEYCLGRFPAECMVNASLGREREHALTPAETPKRVVVVGGGPGGMEAARVAALRGHRVTLHERRDMLGGQLLPAADASFKDSLGDLRDNLALQLERAGVEVVLGSELGVEHVREIGPDAVVVATGAEPLEPPIPGIRHEKNLTVLRLHGRDDAGVGERVVVAGGGLNGCDAAVDLALAGKRVTLVERNGEIGRDLNHISRGGLLHRLAAQGVEIVTGHEVTAFDDEGVRVRATGGTEPGDGPVDGETERALPADTVVLALGAVARNDLVRPLKGEVPELYAVGDCLKPRKIGEAIHEGFRVGLRL